MAEPVEALFSTSAMSTVFSPEAHVRQMLAFEAALAQAEARAGIIPHEAALSIAASCRAELFDIAALYREAAMAGTPAIPLVRMLTAQVEDDAAKYFNSALPSEASACRSPIHRGSVGARNASKYVHWGATSQDAIDTALMLQMREGLDLLVTDLLSICASCATLAEQHRHTIMIGRTLLQQALPITFGLKAARWLALVMRQVQALREHRARTLAVQLGGAAGTLAPLGEKGLQVVALLAEELNLPQPELPWHTERDRIAGIATTLGIVAGAMAKIAGDLVLLAQTEVGEATEASAPGKGGSSAMPQKRNPVDATSAIAATRLAIGVVPVILSAMAQEHERAVGGWQAEWASIPDLFRFTAHAVERVRDAVAGLQIDPARMNANLDLTQGLVMAEALTTALSPHVGRPAAYRIVQEACKHATTAGIHLRQAAMQDAQVRASLSPTEIDHALDPGRYLGSTDALIDRALEAYRRKQPLQG